MTSFAWMLLAWLANFVASVLPAFAPPSWAILAAFRILGDLPIIPLGIGGAAAAAAGKALLAWGARRGSRLLPRSDRENVAALTRPLERRRAARIAFIAIYSSGPFPSNVLFIAVGAGGRSIREAALTFFVCRAVTDTFWAWVATEAARGPARSMLSNWWSWRSLALEAISMALIVALFKLPWARWLLRTPQSGMDAPPPSAGLSRRR